LTPPSKESLLQQCKADEISSVIGHFWASLHDQEQQELCLEAVYEMIANAAALKHDFSLLNDEQRTQFELDVDMAVITIEWEDIAGVIFDRADKEEFFWSQIGDKDDNKNREIYRLLFT